MSTAQRVAVFLLVVPAHALLHFYERNFGAVSTALQLCVAVAGAISSSSSGSGSGSGSAYASSSLFICALTSAAFYAFALLSAPKKSASINFRGSGSGSGSGSASSSSSSFAPGPAARCTCGCASADAHRARAHGTFPEALVRRIDGCFGWHLPNFAHEGGAPEVLAQDGGLPPFEARLQVVAHASVVAISALLFSADAPSALAVAAGALLCVCILARVPRGALSYCARVHGDVIHYALRPPIVGSVCALSVAWAGRGFSNGADAAAYALIVVAAPLAACALSQPTLATNGIQLLLLLPPLQRLEMYLFSFWHLRIAFEGAWWTWAVVLQLAESPLAPTSNGAGNAKCSEATATVFSAVALALAIVAAADLVVDHT